MASLLTQAQWDRYKSIIRDAHDTFNQTNITWKRSNGWDPFNEGNDTYTDITLEGLFFNNFYRRWGMFRAEDFGEIDPQDTVLILNWDYLSENGWIDGNGNFAFDAGMDIFVYEGLQYKAKNYTKLSQASDRHLLVMISLVRQEETTETVAKNTQPV